MSAAREHFAKVLAAVMIASCLVVIARTHLTPCDEEVSNRDIEHALELIQERGLTRPAPPYSIRDYAGVFEENMQKTDELEVNHQLISWKFYPQPLAGRVVADHQPRASTVHAVLPAASLTRDTSSTDGFALTLDPGSGAKHCAERAVLIWRKLASDSDWPKDPCLTIRIDPDGKARFSPAGAASPASGGRFALRLSPPPLRRTYVYRARSIGRFLKESGRKTGARTETVNVLPPPPESGVRRATEYDWILPGARAGTFTAEVRVANPGDVQVQFYGIDRRLEGAWIGLRRWLPGRARPVTANRDWKNPKQKLVARFRKGDHLRARWEELVAGRKVTGTVDSGLVLLDLIVESRGHSVTDTGSGRVTRTARRVTVAKLRDISSGRTFKLDLGSVWWPGDATGSAPAPAAGTGARR